jgi:hypothetical protein
MLALPELKQVCEDALDAGPEDVDAAATFRNAATPAAVLDLIEQLQGVPSARPTPHADEARRLIKIVMDIKGAPGPLYDLAEHCALAIRELQGKLE